MNLNEAKTKLLLILRNHQEDIVDGNFSDILWQEGFSASNDMSMKLYRENNKKYRNVITVILWKGHRLVLESIGSNYMVWELK